MGINANTKVDIIFLINAYCFLIFGLVELWNIIDARGF